MTRPYTIAEYKRLNPRRWQAVLRTYRLGDLAERGRAYQRGEGIDPGTIEVLAEYPTMRDALLAARVELARRQARAAEPPEAPANTTSLRARELRVGMTVWIGPAWSSHGMKPGYWHKVDRIEGEGYIDVGAISYDLDEWVTVRTAWPLR